MPCQQCRKLTRAIAQGQAQGQHPGSGLQQIIMQTEGACIVAHKG